MVTPRRTLLEAGACIERYRVVRHLGSGGMGEVYEAVHVDLDKRVAIKVLRGGPTDDPVALHRFLREGRAAASVRHPNVVEVSDVGSWNGAPYLVMEYLDGIDLAARLASSPAPPIAEVVGWMLPVFAAVAAAHDEGVLHRDLKPSNIFLSQTRDGTIQPKVVDFGISSMGGERVTSTGEIVGTPAYMSPEQIRGSKDLTPASDQYALGVIVYECLTGRLPVEAGPVMGMLLRIAQGEFPPPRSLRPAIPQALEDVVLCAMALDPSRRFGDCRAFARALLPFAGERDRLVWQPAFDPAVPRPRQSGPDALPRRPSTPRRESRRGRPMFARAGRVIAPIALGAALAWLGYSAAGRRDAPGGRTYVVSVAASPASATLTLDGARLGTGTMHRTFAADGTSHVLRATAPGYGPQAVEFIDGPPGMSLLVLQATHAHADDLIGVAASPQVPRVVARTSRTYRAEDHRPPQQGDVPPLADAPTQASPGVAPVEPRRSPEAASASPTTVAPIEPRPPDRPAFPGVVVPPPSQGVRSPF